MEATRDHFITFRFETCLREGGQSPLGRMPPTLLLFLTGEHPPCQHLHFSLHHTNFDPKFSIVSKKHFTVFLSDLNVLVHPELPVCLVAQRNIGEATDKMGWVSSPQEKLASRLGTLVPEGEKIYLGVGCKCGVRGYSKTMLLDKVVSFMFSSVNFFTHP